MALSRVSCTHCGAGLKSPTGFEVGQAVMCPKCRKQFEVEEPEEEGDAPAKPGKGRPPAGKKPVRAAVSNDDDEDEDEDDRPKKKKKKKKRRDDDDEDEDEKGNVAFYVRLGVLLLVLVVLGVLFLVLGPGGLNKAE